MDTYKEVHALIPIPLKIKSVLIKSSKGFPSFPISSSSSLKQKSLWSLKYLLVVCCCLIRGLGYLAVLHSYMEACAVIYNAPKHQECVNRVLKGIPFLSYF